MIGFTLIESGVAACVLEGLGDKAAAQALGITPGMVAKHVRRLRERFYCRNRVRLALALRQIGEPDSSRQHMTTKEQ